MSLKQLNKYCKHNRRQNTEQSFNLKFCLHSVNWFSRITCQARLLVLRTVELTFHRKNNTNEHSSNELKLCPTVSVYISETPTTSMPECNRQTDQSTERSSRNWDPAYARSIVYILKWITLDSLLESKMTCCLLTASMMMLVRFRRRNDTLLATESPGFTARLDCNLKWQAE